MNCRGTVYLVCLSVSWAIASAPLTAQDEEKLVRGRVVDQHGEPVAGATIATSWNFNSGNKLDPGSGSGRPLEDQTGVVRILRDGNGKQRTMPPWLLGLGVASDARGQFEGMFRIRWGAVLLTAYSADRILGAIVKLDPEKPTTDLTIRLQPTVRVKATFSCNDLGHESVEPLGYLYLDAEPRRIMLGDCHCRKGTLDIRVPPGEYALNVYGRDMDHHYRPMKIAAGRPNLDLGTVDIPASFFALYRGKKLPEWNVTAARGVPEDETTIADFRGKWLIVEFWGFW